MEYSFFRYWISIESKSYTKLKKMLTKRKGKRDQQKYLLCIGYEIIRKYIHPMWCSLEYK